MAVISPVTSFFPKLPYEKFKTIKKNVRLKINMAISGLHPGPRLWCLRGERKHPANIEASASRGLSVSFPFHSFFPSVFKKVMGGWVAEEEGGQRV